MRCSGRNHAWRPRAASRSAAPSFEGVSGTRARVISFAASASAARSGWICTGAALDQTGEGLHADQIALGDRATLVLEHDEAVGFRHRAQDARALLASRAHFPFAAFAEQDSALVLGT